MSYLELPPLLWPSADEFRRIVIGEGGTYTAKFYLLQLVYVLATDWRHSQEIGWNGWTNLEISWAVIMHRAHHGINPEMFFLAPPRLQVWWDRELAQYANLCNPNRGPSAPSNTAYVAQCFGGAHPYPPAGKFITDTRKSLKCAGCIRGPRNTRFYRKNSFVHHSPRFPIAAYLVAYALTLMEQP